MKTSISATALRNDSSSFSGLRKWLLILPALALAMVGNAQAAADTWTGPGGTITNPISGAWDNTTTGNWSTAGAWVAGSDATFAGTTAGGGLTVTLGAPISANSLIFTDLVNNFTIASGAGTAITLNNGTQTGGGGAIQLATGVTATIGSGVTVTRGGAFDIGSNGGNQAGTLIVNGAINMNLAAGSNNSINNGATVQVNTGGSITTNGSNLNLGRDDSGGSGNTTLLVNGGTVTIATGGGLLVGRGHQTNGALTIQNSGTVTFGSGSGVNFGNGGGNNTINLGTGTLSIGLGGGSIQSQGGTSTFNFNGGTLKATGTGNAVTGVLMGSGSGGVGTGALTSANVLAGGAFIDTNGFATSITQALLNGGGGGGLTKNGAGTLTLTGANTYTGATTINAGTLQIGNGGTVGSISNSSGISGGGGTIAFNLSSNVTQGSTFLGALGGSLGLAQMGSGALTLNLANTYTGATTVNVGTLKLDFSAGAAPATNIINSGNALVLGGGTLNATGKASTTNSQTFGTTTLNAGASAFTITNDPTANSVLIALGAITRNTGSTVNFTQPSVGAVGATNGYTTGTGNTNGILGGYATVGNEWATNNGTNIVALAAYQTGTNGSLWASGDNVKVAAATTVNPGTQTINTLNLQTATASGFTVTDAGTLTIGSGGILASETTAATSATHTITGGSLTSSNAANDLIAIVNNAPTSGTTTLSIGSIIQDTTAGMALTKGGTGTLTLTGVNTYTGATTVGAGTLAIGGAGSLGSGTYAGAIVDNGTLNYGSSANQTLSGLVSGTGAVTMSGTGTLTLSVNDPGSTGNSFSGGLNINSGTVFDNGNGTGVSSSGDLGTGTISIGSGSNNATLLLTGNYNAGGSVNNWGATYANAISVNGTGVNTINVTKFNPLFTGAVTLNTSNLTLASSNFSTNPSMEFSGGITGTGNVTIQEINGNNIANDNGFGFGRPGVLISTGGINNTGTLTVTSSGIATGQNIAITGVIGANVTGVTVNSPTSSQLLLSGANLYTGPTTINGGTLNLGSVAAYASPAEINPTGTGSISSSSALVLGGGTLAYSRTGTNTQNFNGTTINPGYSGVTTSLGTQTVGLGALTRNVGGTVTFTNTGTINTSTGTASTILTDANGTAYGVVGTTDWAAKDALNTKIVGLSTLAGTPYTANTATTLSGNADFSVTGTTTLAANTTITSLRMNSAAANTIALNGQTLITGGILIGSGSAANLETISGTGFLKGTAGGDLVIIENSTGAGSLAISSVIADNTSATGLTKGGAGALTLSGLNSYTGATTIGGGTVTVGVAQSGATGALGNNSALTLSNNTANLNLNNFNTTVGSLAGGGIVSGATSGGNIALGSATLTTGGLNTSTTYGGAISGTGGLIKTGTGTQTLTGLNTYTGPTSINNGTLSISAVSGIGAGTTVNLGVAATSSGTLLYTGAATTLSQNINALGNGSDTVQNTGTGLLTLSGGIVKNGTTLTLNGGTKGINVTGVISGAAANSDLNVTGGTTTISTLATYSGPTWIYGNGILVNGVSGGALPTGTTLNIGSATSGGTTSAGTFDLGGNNQSVTGLNTAGTGPSYTNDFVTNNGAGNAILTVTGGGTFAGIIQDGSKTTGLTSTGGTLNLSGVNTYTGATGVTGGTLNLTGSNVNSTTTVSGSGTFTGTGSAGPLVLNNGGTIAPGNGTTPSTLTAANLTWNSAGSQSSTLSFVLNGANTNSTRLTLTGGFFNKGTTGGAFNINLTDTSALSTIGTYDLVDFTGGSTNFAIGDFTQQLGSLTYASGFSGSLVLTGTQLDFVVVPEPGTWAMMLGGFALLVAFQRRKSKS